MPTPELNLPCIFRPASRLLPLYQRAPKLGFLPPRVQNCCSFSPLSFEFRKCRSHVSPLPVKASLQLQLQPLAPKVGFLRQRLRNSVAASAPKNLPFYRVWKLLLTPLPNGVGKDVCCLWFRSTLLARPCKSFFPSLVLHATLAHTTSSLRRAPCCFPLWFYTALPPSLVKHLFRGSAAPGFSPLITFDIFQI